MKRQARNPTRAPAAGRPPAPSSLLLQPVALACLLAGAPLWAQAQTGAAAATGSSLSTSATALDAVVVTGARAEREVGDVPQRIDVIEGAALDATQAQDIRELVRDLPNVEVRRAPQRFGAVLGATGREIGRAHV